MENAVFLQPARQYKATDIFDGCKPLKMGAIRKPRCQTGGLNAAERRDARERRSDGDVEKAMDGFFNNLLGMEMMAWVNWPHERIADHCYRK